jgi:hypothetical protein
MPLSSLQEKGWRHLRPPFHIGRAKPTDSSAFVAKRTEASFPEFSEKSGVFFEKSAR